METWNTGRATLAMEGAPNMGFCEMTEAEMMETDGGFIITLTIGAIIGAIGTAYGLGYVIGETIQNIKKKQSANKKSSPKQQKDVNIL